MNFRSFLFVPPPSNELLEPAPPLPPFKVNDDGNDSDGGDSDGDGDGVGDDATAATDGDYVNDDDSGISSMAIRGGERPGRQATQRDNQPNERGAMRGRGVMEGGGKAKTPENVTRPDAT
jgi:hypothetical protein